MDITIQYYDSKKHGQQSVEDFAIDLHITLPKMYAEFGNENVFIHTDAETKQKLEVLGADTSRVFTQTHPEDLNHTMRWLSIMSIITVPFQITPIGTFVGKLPNDCMTVMSVKKIPFIPVLAKYGIEQTGGVCGGDILGMCDINVMLNAFISARDIITNEENIETITEAECQVIMGAMLYKSATEAGINITKYP